MVNGFGYSTRAMERSIGDSHQTHPPGILGHTVGTELDAEPHQINRANSMRVIVIVVLRFLSLPVLAGTLAVKIETGLIQGVTDDNVIVYKGIPFAAPPLSHLAGI
jgi:hypothetical protein